MINEALTQHKPLPPPLPALTSLVEAKGKLVIKIRSFGIKSGQSFPSAHLYLDCRGLADPTSTGMSGSGDDKAVQDWIQTHSNTDPYFSQTIQGIQRLSTRRGMGKEFDDPFIILTMCAHGIHRSRAMKWILANQLKGVGYQNVKVE